MLTYFYFACHYFSSDAWKPFQFYGLNMLTSKKDYLVSRLGIKYNKSTSFMIHSSLWLNGRLWILLCLLVSRANKWCSNNIVALFHILIILRFELVNCYETKLGKALRSELLPSRNYEKKHFAMKDLGVLHFFLRTRSQTYINFSRLDSD